MVNEIIELNGQKYQDIEEHYTKTNQDDIIAVRKHIIDLVSNNMPMRVAVKASGNLEKVIEYVPRILVLLLNTKEGVEILKELDLYGQITEYLTSNK